MQKKDLMKDLEKTSFSLSMSVNNLEILKNAISAMRFLSLYDKSDNSFDHFNEKEIEETNSIFNINTVLETTFNYMKKQKIFEIGYMNFSLVDLATINQSVLFDLLINIKVSLHEIVNVRKPEDVKIEEDPNYIKEVYEDIENAKIHCKDMNIEDTSFFLIELMNVLEFDLDIDKFDKYIENASHNERSFEPFDFYEDFDISYKIEDLYNRLKEIVIYILDNDVLDSIIKTKILRNMIFNENHDTTIDPIEYYYKRKSTVLSKLI